jgi:deoxyribonuclease V
VSAAPDDLRGFDDLTEADALIMEQERLAAVVPTLWRPPDRPIVVAGAFVAFARGEQGPGRAGDHAHVGAAATRDTTELERVVVEGVAGAAYAPGLLAAREGAMLEVALRTLVATGVQPDVLLIDATGRDHPRRAGLALHLGAMLDLPSVGVTHRPLLATGPEPGDEVGAWTELVIDGDVVGRWLRTKRGVRPLAIHAGWRTEPDSAVEVVGRVTATARTPEPLRVARTAARQARSAARSSST